MLYVLICRGKKNQPLYCYQVEVGLVLQGIQEHQDNLEPQHSPVHQDHLVPQEHQVCKKIYSNDY